MRCIYCVVEQGTDQFTRPEHVLPRSFGTFENSFTLRNLVCDACNQYFGDNLELDLGRDTFEGDLRYTFGTKDASDYKSVGKRSRLIRKVAEGPFQGAYAYLKYSPEQDAVVLAPLPQVGFLTAEGGYKFFVIDQIPSDEELREKGFRSREPNGIFILGCDAITAKNALLEKGIKLNVSSEGSAESTSPDVLCEIEGTVDHAIFRAIAKMGFNYLAYWQDREFILHPGFDSIRRYIRQGTVPGFPPVLILDRSILADERSGRRRRLSHLVTVSWAADGVSIVAQVSLFNWMTYSVCLAEEFQGEHRELTKGHAFDPLGHQILDLWTGETC